MAVINLRMSSVLLKMVGAERLRAKDIRTINIFDTSPLLLLAFCWTKDVSIFRFHEHLFSSRTYLSHVLPTIASH
jgi:hypothetical protein